MLTKKERMEMLSKAGHNTNKYFTLDVNEAIPAGAKIHIVVDKDGNYVPEIISEVKDDIFNMIIEDGYVRNTKLHRRFVMAQMFYMLNYASYDGRYRGYNECLKRMYGYSYTLNMMLEEVKVLGKLEVRDRETFDERRHFFTVEVIMSVLSDYVEKLKKHVDNLPTKNCKGVPYKRIGKQDIFVEDLGKKLYQPIIFDVYRIRSAKNYNEIYNILNNVMHKMVKLPYDTPKSKAWIDAFKGEGAYYTMKNLIMYHNCKILARYEFYTTQESMDILKRKLDEYYGEGWRMFAMMKKLINDNDFNFYDRMKEIYNK